MVVKYPIQFVALEEVSPGKGGFPMGSEGEGCASV